MILATVGMQLPFDRLIRLIDVIAPELSCPVIAQIGEGRYRPANMEWQRSLRPSEFERLSRAATVIVAHAGIGTVLTARRLRKPLVLFPRREALGEHRNDHQVATARAMTGRPGIGVALHGAELRSFLRHPETIGFPEPVDTSAGHRLRSALTEYLANSARSEPARPGRGSGSRLAT
jgi:UDP-N-acetylglucosamine transferase subunit ALG13